MTITIFFAQFVIYIEENNRLYAQATILFDVASGPGISDENLRFFVVHLEGSDCLYVQLGDSLIFLSSSQSRIADGILILWTSS